ncbi:7708_t:CDS:2 [Entrophospora sp. SA101]|nr:7708_t:CDS:2 [Entrophospora sp. SA101]
MAQQIRAPAPGEAQTITESVRNTFNNINSIFQRTPVSTIPRGIIDREFDDIKNAVKRLREILDWEKNRADQAQVQVNQKNQDIRRLNTGITQAEGDYRILLLAYHNEKNERRHWFYSYKDKHRRVGTLLREKFATQLLLRNYSHRLQQSQNYARALRQELDTCRDDLLLSDIQLDTKWGNPGEDPEDFLRDFQRYVVASRINVTAGAGGVAGRAEADGLFESCLEGPALNWYETNIKGKNWKCNNISDNLGVATITAIRTLGAGNGGNQIGGLNTAGEFRNEASAEIGRIGAGIATGANLIPNGTWNEDWSIAGGMPVNDAPVAPNGGGGFPNVTIAPGMKLGQKIYRLRYFYTTVEAQKQMAIFGQLMQGSMQVEEFSNKIKKLGKLAGMSPQQQREQFIRGLSPMNQYNLRMMAKFHDSQDNITTALAEAEKYTLAQVTTPSSFPVFPTPNPHEKNKHSSDMTPVNPSKSQEIQANDNSVSRDDFKKLYDIVLGLKETMAGAKRTLSKKPGPGKRKADDLAVDRFLESLPVDTSLPGEGYDYDPVEELRLQFEELDINQAKIAKAMKLIHAVVKKSSKHRCSNCNRTGHNSRKCTRKKRSKSRSKKRGSVNKVAVDSGSDTNSSDNDSSGNDSSDNNSDSGDSSSEVESDHSFDSGSKKRQSLESPIQRSSQKIQKKSGMIIDSQIRKIILAMFNDPENDKPLVSDQISQEVDSNEGGNESLEEEWHAPTDFSLESTNSTLKKNA